MRTLITNDGVNFQIDLEIASKFKILEGFPDEPIPIPNVNGATMTRILKFARDGVIECPDPWLIKDPDYVILFEIARAADFLDYQGCLDNVCQIIATSLQGKSPQEVGRILG